MKKLVGIATAFFLFFYGLCLAVLAFLFKMELLEAIILSFVLLIPLLMGFIRPRKSTWTNPFIKSAVLSAVVSILLATTAIAFSLKVAWIGVVLALFNTIISLILFLKRSATSS